MSRAPEDRPSRRSRLAGPGAVGLLVVLCVVLAVVLGVVRWRGQEPSGGGDGGAVTSVAARESGLRAASELTRQVLSYDWRSLDSDVAATEKVLAPSFRSEYARTMAGVREQTVSDRVRLEATPVATAVVSATDTQVEALVFVDQVTTARGAKEQRVDQNRVLVTVTRDGGEWRVSQMDAF